VLEQLPAYCPIINVSLGWDVLNSYGWLGPLVLLFYLPLAIHVIFSRAEPTLCIFLLGIHKPTMARAGGRPKIIGGGECGVSDAWPWVHRHYNHGQPFFLGGKFGCVAPGCGGGLPTNELCSRWRRMWR
jgi:hypothetical protein